MENGHEQVKMWLHSLLREQLKREASDLFLKTGAPPSLRIVGDVMFLKSDPVEAAVMERVADVLLGTRADEFQRNGETDLAYEVDGIGRFRVNVFRQRGLISAALRHVKTQIPSFEELNLPVKQMRHLAAQTRGLVLITGVTGSGKSTTLAAMVGYMNQNFRRHIITIEDPVEFVHNDGLCLVEQREVGLDTASFESALRHVVRQSPDVILVGEMRDRTTIETAINAAEIGHLVLSTLHTADATQTLERMIAYFPPHLHHLIRTQIATTVQGILAQQLVKLQDGSGRVPAVELMMRAPTICDLIVKNEPGKLTQAIADDTYFGSRTMNQALMALQKQGKIDEETALAASPRPQELRNELKGLTLGQSPR
jgi:twitching motility protein PilT